MDRAIYPIDDKYLVKEMSDLVKILFLLFATDERRSHAIS